MIGAILLYLTIGLCTTMIANAFLEGDDDIPMFIFFLFWPAVVLVCLFAGTEYVLRGSIRGEWGDWRFRL